MGARNMKKSKIIKWLTDESSKIISNPDSKDYDYAKSNAYRIILEMIEMGYFD
jgi:hypothetical protein